MWGTKKSAKSSFSFWLLEYLHSCIFMIVFSVLGWFGLLCYLLPASQLVEEGNAI